METFEVTKLGERGQIVIPQEFRKSLDLQTGEKFIVMAQDDTLIFKRLKAPKMQELEKMLSKSRAHARKHKITQKEVNEAIKRV